MTNTPNYPTTGSYILDLAIAEVEEAIQKVEEAKDYGLHPFLVNMLIQDAKKALRKGLVLRRARMMADYN